MLLPRMDSDPTAVDRLPSAQRVTATTTIAKVCGLLRATGEAATVVFEGGRPVGIVTAAALVAARAEHCPETPVARVMDYVAVRVDPQGDTYETVRAFRRTAWDWLEHGRACRCP
jgi:CBS domain-containing protein